MSHGHDTFLAVTGASRAPGTRARSPSASSGNGGLPAGRSLWWRAGHLNIFPSIIPMGDRGVLAQIRSASVVGLEASVVWVELDVSRGLPTFAIVGLRDTAVREARERVRAAVRKSGYEMPVRRITVNLAPADTRKAGPVFDLPIALGILTATRQIPPDVLRGYIVVGELSLDGAVRPVPGVLSIALAARGTGVRGVVVPAANAGEAALIAGLAVHPVRHLSE